MSTSDWNAFVDQSRKRISSVKQAVPDVGKAFSALAVAATAPGVLDAKTKELIALAIAITARCDGCIAFHVKAVKQHGATREELAETIGMAIYMGGGPSLIYGAETLAAYDALDADG